MLCYRYTSILPPEAEEISFEEAQKYFHHGERPRAGSGTVAAAFTGHVTWGWPAHLRLPYLVSVSLGAQRQMAVSCWVGERGSWLLLVGAQ